MTEWGPARRQLDELLRAHGLYEECSIYSFAEWLIDGIESVYRTMQDAYGAEDPTIEDSALDDAMAKLERLIGGRYER